ncbi:hypothetical protein [Mesorhizobium sp. M1403]|uniref:hypothetical protein n=1 Tax=Mesorhizobium sp. M1403 TaxID=2957097 RepID=UPI00333D9CB5
MRSIGKAWATDEVPQDARFVAGGQAKAFVEDANVAPSLAPADRATGGGIGGGCLAGTLTELQNQISPLSYSSELIGKVVVVLACASAVLVIGGIAYRRYVTRKAPRPGARHGAGMRQFLISAAGAALGTGWRSASRSRCCGGGWRCDRHRHAHRRHPWRQPPARRHDRRSCNHSRRLRRDLGRLRTHQAQGADELRAKIEKENTDAIHKGVDARTSLDQCIDADGVYDFKRQRCNAATLGPR